MKKHTFKMLTAAFLAGTMLLASTGCSNKPVSSAPSSVCGCRRRKCCSAGFLRWKGDNPHWRWPKFQCKLYNICRHWKSDHEG